MRQFDIPVWRNGLPAKASAAKCVSFRRMRAGRAAQAMDRFFYTYVLKSLKDGKFYIGWSDDLRSRIEKHNKGQVNSTKGRAPLKLVYYEACLSKEEAIKREKSLKTGFGRLYLKNRIGKA
jgi:putative endonuclease